MSDEELVRRLVRFEGKTCVSSDDEVLAAEAIERLTREREQWKSEIEQVADVWEIMWRGQHKEARADWLIDDILAYVKDKDAELDAAERKVERLREALADVVEALAQCEAGPRIEAARAALAETEKGDEGEANA